MNKDNVITLDNNQIQEKKVTYFEKRIYHELQLDKDKISTSARWRHEPGKYRSLPLVYEAEGNIKLLYIDPQGFVQQYEDSRGKLKDFYRTRLAEPKPDKNGNIRKYTQPYKSGVFPFLTPGILNKYKDKTAITTLFIVEGELKALAADFHLGVDIIGLGGIHNFVEKEINELHRDIKDIIEQCKVKNIVLIFDADCLELTEDLEKDLYHRPYSFYTAIKRFKEYCKPLNVDLYFTHIKSEYIEIAKGLDDLIVYSKTNRDMLKKELSLFTTGQKKYLECKNISDNSISVIYSYLGLDNVKSFYEKHEKKIQEREFIFKNTRYYHDGEKLKVSWYGEASQFMRVGTNYYKQAHLINAQKKAEETLLDWTPAEINRDYLSNKEFFNQIPKYDVFCNVPDHSEKYQKIITVERDGIKTVAYNRYFKLEHVPEKGEYPNIEKFLSHIANSTNLKGESLFPFLLDWLTLCYLKPTQMLPVLCLVSKERNTGKSTFLQFLRLLFNENATILDNERFTGKFTSHYITKLIIGVDESFIPVEKDVMKERIKNLAVGKRQWLEAKGKNALEIEFFGKLVLCSNNENNFMKIDIGENRHCVLKMKVLENDDTRLLEKMEKEIPAFFYHLKNRPLYYNEEKSRSWFDFEVFMTETMLDVQDRTKTMLERELDRFIKDCFISSDLSELEFSAKDLSKAINEEIPHKTSPVRISDILKERGMKPQTKKRYDLYNFSYEFNEFEKTSKTGTPYLFLREEWLNNEMQ